MMNPQDQEMQKTNMKLFFNIIRNKNILIMLLIMSMLAGVSLSYLAGSIDQVSAYIKNQIGSAFTATSTFFAHVLGSILGGFLIENSGAKLAVGVSYALLVLGPLIMVASSVPSILGLGYFILEFGVAMNDISFSNLVAEISPAQARGKLVTMTSDNLHVGRLLASIIHLIFIKAEAPWRFMVLISVVFPIIQVIFLMKIPNTAIYHMQKNNVGECISVLKNTLPEEDVDKEFSALKNSFQETKKALAQSFCRKCKTILKDKVLRRGLLAAVVVQVIQQSIGVQTILYYSPIVNSPKLCGVGVLVIVETLSTLMNFILVDQISRKSLISTSLTICGTSLAVLSVVFFFDGVKTQSGFVLVCIYVSSYSMFFGAAPSVVSNEVFPANYRGVGVAISTVVKWTTSLVVSISFLPLKDAIGSWGMMLFYSLLSVLGFILVRVFVPEMGCVSLGNVQQHLRGRPNSEQDLPVLRESESESESLPQDALENPPPPGPGEILEIPAPPPPGPGEILEIPASPPPGPGEILEIPALQGASTAVGRN